MAEPHAAHHPALQHHFDDLGQQHEATTLGMWFFLTTEILFFGPLFFVYGLFRSGALDSKFTDAFILASHHQNILLGTVNTAVLILSSLTVALSVYFAQTNNRRALVICLILTLILGGTFLGIKVVEYAEHIHHNLVPGANFQFPDDPSLAPQAQMFFFLYFCMTGLHAIHMVVGIGIFLWLLNKARKGTYSREYYGPVEICGLYWHFVDIVWIFLFPMLYLIDPLAKSH